MPASVQDLLVEIDRIHVHALTPWRSPTHRCPCTSHSVRPECRFVCLEQYVIVALDVVYPEVVVVRSSHHLRAVPAKRALELVENAVVFVEVAELPTEMIMNVDSLHRSTIHVHIPDLEAQVITRQDVPPVSAELDVGNRRDNLRKE